MGFRTSFEGRNLKLNLFFVTKLQQTKCSIMNSFPLKPEHSTLGILAHSVAAIQFQLSQFGSSLVRHEDLRCVRAATHAQTPSGTLHNTKILPKSVAYSRGKVFILGHLQLSELREITT